MVTFNDRWLEIEARLKENAEPLGIPQANIVRGDFQKDLSIFPPGLLIYMESGDTLFAANPMSTVATVRVFCVIAPQVDIPNAVGVATDLAWKVVRVLKSMEVYIRWPRNPVSIDTVHADIACTEVAFLTAFDMPSLAPVTAGISTIPGMQLWLDAAVIAGVLNNEGLRTWIDRSGNAHDALQLDLATRPIYQTDRLNGKPAIHFDGTQFMLAPILPLTTGLTCMIVCRVEYPGFNTGLIAQKETFAWRADDGGTMGAYTWANVTPRGFGSPPITDGVWRIITLTYSPTASLATLRDGGTQVGSDLGQSGNLLPGTADMEIGKGFFADFYGEIAEVAIYQRALTSIEINQVETYLSGKYQIPIA